MSLWVALPFRSCLPYLAHILFLIPLLLALRGRFSRSEKPTAWYQQGMAFPRISQAFTASLQFALSRPILTAIVIGILPIAGFFAAGKMTEQFFPSV